MSIDKLIELAAQLPEGLHADWRGTNHYELRSTGEKFWWLELADYFDGWKEPNWCATDDGKKLGLLMDIAECLKAAEPELTRLRAELRIQQEGSE